MYLRSDWFIQELRYLKFQVHIKMVNGDVFQRQRLSLHAINSPIQVICLTVFPERY